jgi:hypothetical protein
MSTGTDDSCRTALSPPWRPCPPMSWSAMRVRTTPVWLRSGRLAYLLRSGCGNDRKYIPTRSFGTAGSIVPVRVSHVRSGSRSRRRALARALVTLRARRTRARQAGRLSATRSARRRMLSSSAWTASQAAPEKDPHGAGWLCSRHAGAFNSARPLIRAGRGTRVIAEHTRSGVRKAGRKARDHCDHWSQRQRWQYSAAPTGRPG